MRRILHVVPDFGVGGAQRMVMHLLTHHDKEQFTVAAAVLLSRWNTEAEEMIDRSGVPVWYLGKRAGIDIGVVPKVRAILNEFKPDIIHTHRYVLGYVLAAALADNGTKVVHTFHNIASKEVDVLGRLVLRFAFRSHRIVPVSIAANVSKSIECLYGIRETRLIPNAIPVHEYSCDMNRSSNRRQLGLQDHEITFITVGRLAKQKNQKLLLRALAQVRSRSKLALRCLIVGSGELEQSLRATALELNISDIVEFLGDRTDVPVLLNAADIFVLSSDWEGNPLSVMEAMAAGKPVIATAVGGVPELVPHGKAGLLTAPGSEHDLAQAMVDLASSIELQRAMGHYASCVAKACFGVQRMVTAYQDLYVELTPVL